jgi:hypothetical protein
MTTRRQKGKGRNGKRLRAWHHGPGEDRRFRRATQKLDAAAPCPHCDRNPCQCAEIVTAEADDAN